MILRALKDLRLGAVMRQTPATLPNGWELALSLDHGGTTIRLYDQHGILVRRVNDVDTAKLAHHVVDMVVFACVKHSYTLACQLEF